MQCDIQQSSNNQQNSHDQQLLLHPHPVTNNNTVEHLSEEMQVKSEHKDNDKDSRVIMASFPMQELKGQLMDIRTADGSVVKVQADQDVAKALLNADMVQGMYKVNVEDINQLLAYHEVFGKLSTEATQPQQQNGGGKVVDESATVGEGPASPSSVGPYSCELCGKIFPFRYQLIVHRRYHSERKPFTCQVS